MPDPRLFSEVEDEDGANYVSEWRPGNGSKGHILPSAPRGSRFHVAHLLAAVTAGWKEEEIMLSTDAGASSRRLLFIGQPPVLYSQYATDRTVVGSWRWCLNYTFAQELEFPDLSEPFQVVQHICHK